MIGVAYGANVLSGEFAGDPNADLLTYLVEKKTLRDTVVERGTLESQETVQGTCEVPGQDHKIIFIVPEGAIVKKGDEVVRFGTDNIDKPVSYTHLTLPTILLV